MQNQKNQFYDEIDEQEIKLTDYLNIITRYKWLVSITFIIIVISSIIYTARAPRIYKASSKILIEDKMTNDLLMTTFRNKTSAINNNIHILKSRPVIKLTYQIIQNSPQFDKFPINNLDGGSPIGYISSNLTVDTERETELLFINFESTSPIEAKEIVNALAHALKNQDTDYARTEFRNTREFLANQLDNQERQLRNVEEDLRLYKIEHGVSILSEETKSLIEKSSDLSASLSEAITELDVSTKHLDFLKGELTEQDSLLANVNSVLTSPLLEQLKKEIVQKQTQYVNYLTEFEYSKSHPELVALKKAIDQAKSKLNEEIKNTLQVKAGQSDPLMYRSKLTEKISTAQIEKNINESKVVSLKKAVEEYNKKMSILPDTEVELARLERNFKNNEKIYSILMEKYENAKIVEKSKIGSIRIVEEALIPKAPIKPNKKMNIIIAIVLGAGLGIGAALLIHSLDSKIRTFDDVKKAVALPILGTIPLIEVSDEDLDKLETQINNSDGSEKEDLQITRQQIASNLITNYASKSSASEAFRILRTNIISKRKNTDSLSILITSSGPKEGKSTIISNLAATLGQMDAKVVLVDLDLRRPMQHKLFNIDKKHGISEYISEQKNELSDYIKKSKIKNLDLITSGIIPPNPSELLASSNMTKAIAKLKESYDYVMIDSPPVIAVTDSMVLAKKVDILTLAVRVSQADKKVIQRTKELLENIDVKIDGAVINGIRPHSYYSSYEYNYYYYYYYGDEEHKKTKPSILRKNKSIS